MNGAGRKEKQIHTTLLWLTLLLFYPPLLLCPNGVPAAAAPTTTTIAQLLGRLRVWEHGGRGQQVTTATGRLGHRLGPGFLAAAVAPAHPDLWPHHHPGGLLGGDRLDPGQHPAALLLLGGSASLAAIGFGILVALYARTAEQATSFSAAAIMIMAALGGVLVPKAVMPLFMQQVSVVSPLAWGLDGFLEVFVRGGSIRDVLPDAARLIAFSALCHGIARLRYERRI